MQKASADDKPKSNSNSDSSRLREWLNQLNESCSDDSDCVEQESTQDLLEPNISSIPEKQIQQISLKIAGFPGSSHAPQPGTWDYRLSLKIFDFCQYGTTDQLCLMLFAIDISSYPSCANINLKIILIRIIFSILVGAYSSLCPFLFLAIFYLDFFIILE